MRMDTETISYVLEGHELQNDVQTMIQVFLANRHYPHGHSDGCGDYRKKRDERGHCFGNALSPWGEGFRMVDGI